MSRRSEPEARPVVGRGLRIPPLAIRRRGRETPPYIRLRGRGLALLPCVLLALVFTGCERETRRFQDNRPETKPALIAQSDLRPGPGTPLRESGPYDDEAWSVAEGQRYFTWFNCVGCHANGGGGMGPPLMDDKWIYGAEPDNIFASIMEGRPNGMPSFRGRIPEQQVWQLVGYVRSLSGQLRKDVEPGRADQLTGRPAPQSTPPGEPKKAK